MPQSIIATLRQLPLEQRIALLLNLNTQPAGKTASVHQRVARRQVMASIDSAEYDQILRAQMLEAAIKGTSVGLEKWKRPAIALGWARQALPDARLEWFTLKNTGLISQFVRGVRKAIAQWSNKVTLKVSYEDVIQKMIMGIGMDNNPYPNGPVAAFTGAKASKVIANGTYAPSDTAGYLVNYGYNRVRDEVAALDAIRSKNVDMEGEDILDRGSDRFWVSRDADVVDVLVQVIADRDSEAYKLLLSRFQRAFHGDQKWAQMSLDYLTRLLHGEKFKDGDFAREWGVAHGGFSAVKQKRIKPFLERLQQDDAFLQSLEALVGF